MLTRSIVIGAALALALSTGGAGAAGLFDFGRRDSTQVDPQAVQQMADQLTQLQSDVVSLTAQVQELTVELQQLRDQAHIGAPPIALSSPIGPVPSTAPVPPVRAPASVATIAPPATIPGAVAPVPSPSTTLVSPAITPLGGTASIGTGAKLGPLSPDAAPTVSGQPLDLSKGTTNPAPASTTASLPQLPGTTAAPLPTTPGPAAPGGALTSASGAPVQTAALTPTGNAQADYDKSYAFITSGRYDLAESSFRSFLTAYPKNDLAGDAQYWLGESLFQRGKYSDAAAIFRTGYTAYPKSDKAPDTLLALGQSLAGLGQRDEACQIYSAALKQHPTMAAALKQRVLTEQASAACPA